MILVVIGLIVEVELTFGEIQKNLHVFKQLNVLLQTGALNPTPRIILSIRPFVGWYPTIFTPYFEHTCAPI